MLIAKVLGTENGGPGVTLTLGPEEQQEELMIMAEKFGNTVAQTPIQEIEHDADNKVISIPSKLYPDATPAQVFANVQAMVSEVVQNVKSKAPQPITIFSTVEVSPEKNEEFEEMMQALSIQSRKEKGIIRFDVHQDAENLSTYNMYMVFRDADAITSHRQTEHFKMFVDFKEQEGSLLSQGSQILKGVTFTM